MHPKREPKATHQEAASDGITRRVLRDACPCCTSSAARTSVRRARHPTPPTAARGVVACRRNSRPQSARRVPAGRKEARVTCAQGERSGAVHTRRALSGRVGRLAAKRSSPGCKGVASRQARKDVGRRLKPRWLTEVPRECAARQPHVRSELLAHRTPAYAAERASMLNSLTKRGEAESCGSEDVRRTVRRPGVGRERASHHCAPCRAGRLFVVVSRGWNQSARLLPSTCSASGFARCGCRSLRSALASICRMRSRVTRNTTPTSSSVLQLPSAMP